MEAYSVNVTVTNTQGPGFILIYPLGGAQPTVSTVNYVAGQTIANAAIVPAGTFGAITVVAGVSGTDLILDINGYFTDEYNVGNRFAAIGTCSACAMVLGDNDSPTAGSHAVGGFAGGAGRVYGVQGQIGSGTASSSAGAPEIPPTLSVRTTGVEPEFVADDPVVEATVRARAFSGLLAPPQ